MASFLAILLFASGLHASVIQDRLSTRQQGDVSINAPGDSPNGAKLVDRSFCGFAFELTSFPMYAGAPGQPNRFSQNMINQISSRTGTKPSIRVGGTSTDRSRYVPTQSEAVKFPPNQVGNVPTGVTTGPRYFGSFANFPDAEYTWDLPLSTNDLSNTLAMAKAGWPVIKNRVKMIQIGNEVQGYPGHVRPASWSPSDYIREYTTYSNAINNAIGVSNKRKLYQAVTLGSPALYETSDNAAVPGPFYPSALFNAGLDDLAPRISSVSMHYYQTRAKAQMSQVDQLRLELMDHSILVRKMSFFRPAIDYFASKYPNIRVDLGEVASSLNGMYNAYDLESTFGAALWQVDFMLWSMSIGVRRINWQQINAAAFDLWQPIESKGRYPAVLPPAYAMFFCADFITRASDTRVVNIDLNSKTLVAYAAYNNGKLSRVAIINMAFWSSDSGGARGSTTFAVRAPSGASRATVRKLAADSGATASYGYEMTWAGKQWTAAEYGIPKQVGPESNTVSVVNGVARVTLRASEAVIVSF